MKIPFTELLRSRQEAAGWTTEEILDAVLPLFEQVALAHDAGLVACTEGADHLMSAGTRLWFENRVLRPPLTGDAARAALDATDTRDAAPFATGYRCWETLQGHHDALSDVFILGLVFASFACGLDLNDEEDLALFVRHRRNLVRLRPELHPVLAREIAAMTELDRRRRARELDPIVARLRTWSEDDASTDDLEIEIENLDDAEEPDAPGHRARVLSRLQQRLYQISRRNRLLYFRPTLQNIDLSVASVSLGAAGDAASAAEILTWNGAVADALQRGAALDLSRHLHAQDAPYAQGILTKIRATARRDRAEFGFSQLRLVLAFLHWHDLKQAPDERITSPLLLLPVRLERKKGVRDTWHVTPTSRDAEINPTLLHHLRQLYGLELPATIPATLEALTGLHAELAERVAASASGVRLELRERPDGPTMRRRARRRLDAYLRRVGSGARPGMRRYRSLAYSYDPKVFEPLGIQLYRRYVQPDPLPLPAASPGSSALAETSSPAPSHREPERPATDGDRQRWEIDLCRLTLGNFRYRKMSLVGDYDALITRSAPHPVLDALFSLEPRATELPSPPVPRDDRYPVVPCDATQAAAIASARTGGSYLIQGPPGTGKSQTIANLIADFVARGRRVLFVCQKRAAIDVVYHRLRRDGLDALCCLIHDSQEDKKAFIADLRQSYEEALAVDQEQDLSRGDVRTSVLEAMAFELELLEDYDRQMRATEPQAGLSLRALITRRLATRDGLPALRATEMEELPDYALWCAHREALARIVEQLTHLVPGGAWGRHPLSRVNPSLASRTHPLRDIEQLVADARASLDRLRTALEDSGAAPVLGDSLTDIDDACSHAARLRPLAATGHLALLDRTSPESATWDRLRMRCEELHAALQKTEEATTAWRTKLAPEETRRALEQAKTLRAAWLPFLRPSWWRLRRVLRTRYDHSAHALRPDPSEVLSDLHREHRARAEWAACEAEARERFAIDEGVADFAERLDALRATCDTLGARTRDLHRLLLDHPEPATVLEPLRSAQREVADLREPLARLLADADSTPEMSRLEQALGEITHHEEVLPDFLPVLAAIDRLPAALQSALRHPGATVPQVEGLVIQKTLKAVYRSRPGLSRFTDAERSEHLQRLAEAHGAWLDANAAWIVAFSQAQQEAIEEALEELAIAEPAFSDLLDAAYERSEDDEFKGLLVKNLENMQGDERDVVILSVCYGPDARGRVRMHFGPINQAGGEKRLNVAFTRAKRHMVVVTSLRPDDITNDHNDGARCLRDYLRYAAAVSRGDGAAAGRVLAALMPPAWRDRESDGPELAATQIADALRQRGFVVEHEVGRSRFRCDLALRRPEDDHHRVAVVLDGAGHYRHRDVIERDLHRPAVLRAFGWRVVQVLAQEWARRPEAVLGRIEEAASTSS